LTLERQVKADPGLLDRYEAVYRKTYDSAEKSDLILLAGSLGLLELAVREGSAADRLKVRSGDGVIFSLGNG
jgi:S-adenosylmethionine hydrolase